MNADVIPIDWIREQIKKQEKFEEWEMCEYGESYEYSIAWSVLIERWEEEDDAK